LALAGRRGRDAHAAKASIAAQVETRQAILFGHAATSIAVRDFDLSSLICAALLSNTM
jgi:hypothetical protein